MNQITFYPGPSQLYPQVEGYLQDAYRSGILSMNHRSATFMDMLAQTTAALHQKLSIPAEYEIYFTSSATECWEIVSQSLVEKGSLHVFNGAFGQKWYEYASRLHPTASLSYSLEEHLPTRQIERFGKVEMLCLTHNETSNGTMISVDTLNETRQQFKGLIAVDATSSMAGVALPWLAGDVWFASVQKCFGLPPGLGVLIVSPRAIERAEEIGERDHYNSLLFIRANFVKHQTPYTPNTLSIYLLGRVMAHVPEIRVTDRHIRQRAHAFYEFLHEHSFQILVENKAVLSPTVITVRAEEIFLKKSKAQAREAGIMLGNGYGSWKTTTFRIANFPAISEAGFGRLRELMAKNHP